MERRKAVQTMSLLAAAAALPTAPAAQASVRCAEQLGDDEPHHTTRELVTEDAMIASDTPNIQLFVRNKRPRSLTQFAEQRILLYVHGATYPSETAFDLRLDGLSWMDYIAAHGWDVYLLDLRGYGRSTRPSEMDQPPADNAPSVTTDVAVRDVGTAVEHVLARRGVQRINLLGWSWGTSVMGAYSARNPEKVRRLVLYAPLWLRKTPLPAALQGSVGAYRTVTKDQAKKRWLNGVPESKQSDLVPPGWFDTWADATWSTDPAAGAGASAQLRAPNGVLRDLREYWAAGKPYYDAAAIRAPTLIALAEWDADTPAYMAQDLFAALTSAPYKRKVEIGEGTHTIIMEKNRMQLFREVQLFLDEPDPMCGG